MKKLLGPACFAALLALFAAGCATTEVEEPIPVDITLEELQSKMTRAMDPTRPLRESENLHDAADHFHGAFPRRPGSAAGRGQIRPAGTPSA